MRNPTYSVRLRVDLSGSCILDSNIFVKLVLIESSKKPETPNPERSPSLSKGFCSQPPWAWTGLGGGTAHPGILAQCFGTLGCNVGT